MTDNVITMRMNDSDQANLAAIREHLDAIAPLGMQVTESDAVRFALALAALRVRDMKPIAPNTQAGS